MSATGAPNPGAMEELAAALFDRKIYGKGAKGFSHVAKRGGTKIQEGNMFVFGTHNMIPTVLPGASSATMIDLGL